MLPYASASRSPSTGAAVTSAVLLGRLLLRLLLTAALVKPLKDI